MRRPAASRAGGPGRLAAEAAGFPQRLPAEPCAAVKFTFQLQPQSQRLLAGKIQPVALPARNGLEPQVLDEPALVGTAEADSPRDGRSGVSGQPEGTAPVGEGLVVEHNQGEVLDFDQALDDRRVDQAPKSRPGPGTGPASAAEAPPPLVQWGGGQG